MNLRKLLTAVAILSLLGYLILFGLFIQHTLPLEGISPGDFFYTFNYNFIKSPINFTKVIVPGTMENKLSKEERAKARNIGTGNFSNETSEAAFVEHPLFYFNEFLVASNSGTSSNYEWYWEDNMVFGRYLSSDETQSLIGLEIIAPKIYREMSEGTKWAFKLNCAKEQTFLIDANLQVLDSNNSVYSLIEDGDSFLGLCSNENCSTLSKSCIIWRNGAL